MVALNAGTLPVYAGVSPAQGLAIWHRFNLVREQPFIHWMMALGAPLPQASLKALGDMSWQQMRERSARGVASLTVGRGRGKLSHSFTILAFAILATWLGKQGLPGF